AQIHQYLNAGSSDNFRYYFDRLGPNKSMVEVMVQTSPTAKTSLGWKLNDLNAMIKWVENGTEPGAINMLAVTDATSQLDTPINNAKFYGFQNDPELYFQKVEGI